MAEQKMTKEFKERFLELLRSIPNVTAVCRVLDVHCSTIAYTRKRDPEFDEASRSALEQGYDMVEEEARRRAVDGVLEPVFYQGVIAGTVRKYSDALLQTLLKAYKPKKFNPGANVSFGDGEKVTLTFNIGSNEKEE